MERTDDELIRLLSTVSEGHPRLDRRIAAAVIDPGAVLVPDGPDTGAPKIFHDHRWHIQPIPHFTTSLDAAAQLIPDGWSVSHAYWRRTRSAFVLTAGVGRYAEGRSRKHTPAIALCIACLRARAVVTATVP